MEKLTKRQIEIVDFIENFIELNSFSPTLKEMAEHFKIATSSIQSHIQTLVFKGVLEKDSDSPRTLVIKKNKRTDVIFDGYWYWLITTDLDKKVIIKKEKLKENKNFHSNLKL